MIDTVVSDLGNVLLHFDNAVFFRKMMSYTARSFEEIRKVARDNADLLTLFERGRISPLDFHRNARELLDATVSYEEFFAIYNDVFFPNPPAIDLLRRLKPGRRMALLSNTDVCRWTFIKSRFPEILFFDGYALSFDVGVMKPDPLIYREALGSVGARPENAVFIDDLAENVEGAERLGMRGIHFTERTDLAAELATLGIS
jgi:HAD superfamily hydrolase (TIGR01509 family)